MSLSRQHDRLTWLVPPKSPRGLKEPSVANLACMTTCAGVREIVAHISATAGGQCRASKTCRSGHQLWCVVIQRHLRADAGFLACLACRTADIFRTDQAVLQLSQHQPAPCSGAEPISCPLAWRNQRQPGAFGRTFSVRAGRSRCLRGFRQFWQRSWLWHHCVLVSVCRLAVVAIIMTGMSAPVCPYLIAARHARS